MKLTLKDKQTEALNEINKKGSYLLFGRIGSGKTAIALKHIQYQLNNNSNENILIIADKNIMNTTWYDEIEKWDDFKNIQLHKLSRKTKITEGIEKAIKSTNNVFIANPEQIRKIYDQFKKMRFTDKEWPFKNIIIDEVHSVKNYGKISTFTSRDNNRTTTRAKRIHPLIKLRQSRIIKNVLGLTGTPVPKEIGDIHAIANFVLRDKSPFADYDYDEFVTTYCQATKYSYSNFREVTRVQKYGPHKNTYSMLYEDLKDNCTFIQPDLDIKLNIDTVWTKLPENIKYYYDDIKSRKRGNSISNKIRLKQIANGQTLHNEKEKKIMDLLLNKIPQNENVIIFYDENVDKENLEKLLKGFDIPYRIINGENTEVPETVKRWNSGEYKVLLGQPKACGAGLNLQERGSTIIIQ